MHNFAVFLILFDIFLKAGFKSQEFVKCMMLVVEWLFAVTENSSIIFKLVLLFITSLIGFEPES